MSASDFFKNSAGRLRSGWRLAVFIIVYFCSLFLLSVIIRVAYVMVQLVSPTFQPGRFLQDLIYRFTLLIAALVVGWLCTRELEGLPWRAVGLMPHRGWFRDLGVGSVIGIASLALATGIATAGGGLTFTIGGGGLLAVIQTLILSAILFVIAALAEEALFRGYPLQTLTRARLLVLGVLLTSVPFAATHLQNPNVAKGFTFINTALAGVWFAVAYLKTRSLWFPLGVHWAWNWALGSLFGLPVSGISDIAPNPLLKGTDLGPAWLTGGDYGIEGGVACTIILIVSTLFIWRTRLISATPEMLELTSNENPRSNKPLSVTFKP